MDRYTLTLSKAQIEQQSGVQISDNYSSRYNAAPTQELHIILDEQPEKTSVLFWGNTPDWSKKKSLSQNQFMSDSGKIGQGGALEKIVSAHRCLVPADGFYIWKSISKKGRVPYRVTKSDKSLFYFLGHWEEYENEKGQEIKAFKMISSPAPASLSSIADDVPLIIEPDEGLDWFEVDDVSAYLNTLRTAMGKVSFDYYPVSPKIESAENDSEDLINHVAPSDQFGNYTLFD